METFDVHTAWERLTAGHKIRHCSWEPDEYLHVMKNRVYTESDIDMTYEYSSFVEDPMTELGWSIYNPGSKRLLTIIEAKNEVNLGHKVTHESFPDSYFLYKERVTARLRDNKDRITTWEKYKDTRFLNGWLIYINTSEDEQ